MFVLTKIARFAAVCTLVIAGALGLPARADELAQNLGPVGPHDPILVTVGSKRVIAFYTPDPGHCDLHAIVWNPADGAASSATGVRMSLNPRQVMHIFSPENKSLSLQCGDDAERLAIVESGEHSLMEPRVCAYSPPTPGPGYAAAGGQSGLGRC
jgi:hypothetical protein